MSESAVADDIGRIGESFFDYQMSQTDLLVGKIDPDRMGKDRVIEAKLARRNDALSFDKRSAPMACSIQIKTILPTTKGVKVTLSVAERLAQGLAPAFVYIIRLDENRKPVETRIIHILGPALGKILKRLRKEFSKGTTEYGDKSITFEIKDATRIGLLGDDLATYLEREIGPDMDEYVKRKGKQKRDLGYEDGKRTKVTGSFEARPINDFIDGLLGLKPLAIGHMKAVDERFGIALPDHSFPKFEPGVMAHFMPKPNARCVLVLGSPMDEVETVCDVTFPPIGSIPMQYFKALLRSPILEATISRTEFQVSTNPVSTNDLRAVADWMAYFSIIVGLSSADGLPIGVRTPLGVERLGVAKGSSPSEEMAGEYTLRLLKALRALRSEAALADRPVKLDDVYLMSSRILSAQNSILGNFRDDVSFDVAKPADGDVPGEVQVVFISGFILGDEHYVYCSTCAMHSSIADDRLIFTQIGPLHFIEAQLLSDFEADFQRYQKKMMRVSRSNACVTYLTDGSHETETTEIDGASEDAVLDEPELAET
ncbi:hypothetical protein ELI47_34265 (plasmid) [Rhizobium ruizarguesonis]|uniref:hypothetical protein n=1 Tax=Rhizobium ruizarguesonis TaxID=2081791 RepID=UPI001031C9EF|nr:hypothetical protein [Rhizobium ruizarguesonis]QND22994.1 hypothetical protein HB774_25180 [Rhizobium leguminosarum bv. viciae]TAU18775.1 hypothetical protein ELI47_34265 [Rhizobium ruizarguesonis]